MAGSLVLINSVSVSSSTATVNLTGIDSTYDVYKVTVNKLFPVNDNVYVNVYADVTVNVYANVNDNVYVNVNVHVKV